MKPPLNKRTNGREMKYAIKAVRNLDQIFDMISQAFEICPEIRNILILFGTTPISPKESYLVSLPMFHPEFDCLCLKNSVKTLFRQIVCNDILGDAKSISPTNMIVMIDAPKHSGITWFIPKPNFKLPVRGKRHIFNLSCKQPDSPNQSILCNDDAVEISGIEPLESSTLDITTADLIKRLSLSGDEDSLQNSTNSLLESFEFSQSGSSAHSTSSVSSLPASNDVTVIDKKNQSNSSGIVCDHINGIVIDHKDIPRDFAEPPLTTDNTDAMSAYMWFQAPVFVKGYKDKSSKHSIFM
jgi:hypothetical protein